MALTKQTARVKVVPQKSVETSTQRPSPSSKSTLTEISHLFQYDHGINLANSVKEIKDETLLSSTITNFANTCSDKAWKLIKDSKQFLGFNDIGDSTSKPNPFECFDRKETPPKTLPSFEVSQKAITLYHLLILCSCSAVCKRNIMIVIKLAIERSSNLTQDQVWKLLWCLLNGWVSFSRYIGTIMPDSMDDENLFRFLIVRHSQTPITIYLLHVLAKIKTRDSDQIQLLIQKTLNLTISFGIKEEDFSRKIREKEITAQYLDFRSISKKNGADTFFFDHYFSDRKKVVEVDDEKKKEIPTDPKDMEKPNTIRKHKQPTSSANSNNVEVPNKIRATSSIDIKVINIKDVRKSIADSGDSGNDAKKIGKVNNNNKKKASTTMSNEKADEDEPDKELNQASPLTETQAPVTNDADAGITAPHTKAVKKSLTPSKTAGKKKSPVKTKKTETVLSRSPGMAEMDEFFSVARKGPSTVKNADVKKSDSDNKVANESVKSSKTTQADEKQITVKMTKPQKKSITNKSPKTNAGVSKPVAKKLAVNKTPLKRKRKTALEDEQVKETKVRRQSPRKAKSKSY